MCSIYFNYHHRVLTKETLMNVVKMGNLLSIALTIMLSGTTHSSKVLCLQGMWDMFLSVAFLFLGDFTLEKGLMSAVNLGSVFLVTSTSMNKLYLFILLSMQFVDKIEFILSKCSLSDVSRRNV